MKFFGSFLSVFFALCHHLRPSVFVQVVSKQFVLDLSLWIFRLRMLDKTNSIVILWPVHQYAHKPKQKLVATARFRTICTRSSSVVLLLPPTHPTRSEVANGPKMHDNDKCVLRSNPHFLCPNSCVKNDAPQMRMRDKETRHASKRVLTSSGLGKKEYSAQESLHEISSDLVLWEQPTACRRSHSTVCAGSICPCGRKLRLCSSR